MALVNCPECQREISNQSQYCIHCGFPMVKDYSDNHLINVLVMNDEKRAKNIMIRAKLELEDKEYTKAEALTENALELEPKLWEAYLIKLFVLLQVSDEKEMVATVTRPLTEFKEYNRALRFAQPDDREKLLQYNREVLKRFENEENEKVYQMAKASMNRGVTEEDYEEAAAAFESIVEYKDAKALSKESRQRGEAKKQQKVYEQAVEKMDLAKDREYGEATSLLLEAGELFQSIENYKDAKERRTGCEEEALRIKNEATYKMGMEIKGGARQQYDYQEAAKLFYSISGYKNAEILAKECEEQGKKVGADYLETLLRKRRRSKIMKKAVITLAIVTVLVLAIVGGLTNFTYSLEEYYNLQQGGEAYLWQEVFEQIRIRFSDIRNNF